MAEQMRVAVGLPSKTDDWHFILARQMGCEEVVLASPDDLPGQERWEYEDLARLHGVGNERARRNRCARRRDANELVRANAELRGVSWRQLDVELARSELLQHLGALRTGLRVPLA